MGELWSDPHQPPRLGSRWATSSPPEVAAVLADLLRRFNRPRAYAGDYEADFARRILTALARPMAESEVTSVLTRVYVRHGWLADLGVCHCNEWRPTSTSPRIIATQHAAHVAEAQAAALVAAGLVGGGTREVSDVPDDVS